MESLGEKKSHLEELEEQKFKLKEEIRQANRRFKWSLVGIGIGILLLPLFWSGVPVIVIAGIMTLIYSGQQTRFKDKLENLETEIHKLEISMA
jgi:hypothetical protein